MEMAASLAQVNHHGHGRDDHWGRGPPRGNIDDEDGLVEEWGVGVGGDTKMMRKRPRSPATTSTASYPVAQRNKSELIQCRRNSDSTTHRKGSNHPQHTKISHLPSSSGPVTTRTRTISGQEQTTTNSMCQNFMGRRDSESTTATGRGLQGPFRQHTPNHCNGGDGRLRSPDRGRDMASRTSERPQRDRDINPPSASFERRALDNNRSRTSYASQTHREETSGSSRGPHFRSGGSWNENRFNRNNDSTPRCGPRQGYGGRNHRNAPENQNLPSMRHDNASARQEATRPNPQPRHFHAGDDRSTRPRASSERPTIGSVVRDFNHPSQSQLTASRRDVEQVRFPERRTHDILDQRRVPPTRDNDSWKHPSPQSRPAPAPFNRPETNSEAWQGGEDDELWRSTKSIVRNFSISNPGSERRPYDVTQDYRSPRGPDPRPCSEKVTSTFTRSSRSPGRDQWHRPETQFRQPKPDRDLRPYVEPPNKPLVSIRPSHSPGRNQWYQHEIQTSQSEGDRDLRQHIEPSDNPLVFMNSSRRPGRDQWHRQETQFCQPKPDRDPRHPLEYTDRPRSNPSRSGLELMPRLHQQVSQTLPKASCTSTYTTTTSPTSNAPRENPAVHSTPLYSRSCSQEENLAHPTKSQQNDRLCDSRKREATDAPDLNAPNKRMCNVTRDLSQPGIHTPPSAPFVPHQSNETSPEKSNPIATPSNPGTSALSHATTSDVHSDNSVKSANKNPPIKKTSIGIPLRWLKPPKPKIVQKAKSKEQPTIAKNSNESKKEEPAPSSPLINRMVTDSEGGSTVSNARELLAMMERKTKQPQVPTAIVTLQTVEDISLDSPPRRDCESKGNHERKVNDGTKVAGSLGKTDTDDEPPLESDDDDDSSIESSSDESETDDEEVMLWASKMFGVPLPATKHHPQISTTNEKNREGKPTSSKKPLKLRLKLSAGRILPGTPSSDSFTANRQNNFVEEERLSYKKIKAVQPELSSQEQVEPLAHVPVRLAVRGRRKKQKSLLKKLPDISPEELQVDLEQERMEREEEKRIREEAKPLTAAQIREILGEDVFDGASSSNWVRRSVRQPSRALLNSKPLKALVEGLKNNDPDMVVLKMKKYINDPNAPSVVLDAALDALEENTNCEALYIQNFNEGMRDKQVLHLLRILQSTTCKIWCLNIGENYNVDTETWDKFTKGLRRTKVTHMYASEHTITTEMKDEIRETIRENRSKHDMHINPNNLDVIIQCTHCWWNPINAKALRPYLKKKGYEHILDDKEAQGLRGSTSEAPSA